MPNRHPHTTAELIEQAGIALIRRDPERLEQLQAIAAGWLQAAHEASAIQTALNAMAEAAELLLDEESGIEIEDEDDEDW